MKFDKKDLLGIKELNKEEIENILAVGVEMKKILTQGVKKVPHLQNKSIVTLFYENSTRTRTSFELAGKFLSAQTSNIAVSTSSVAKGETLIDTGKTLDALGTDVIIMRHNCSGASHLLAKNVKASVINAGDGMNEHPTQALLDMLTMQSYYNTFKGLKVAIIGDTKHSRVARSNIHGLTKLGAEVSVFSASTLLPVGLENTGAKICNSIESAVSGADVVMGLRVQLERQQNGLFPSVKEYHKFFGINDKVLKMASKDALLMHPGPINRGLEITGAVADCTQSVIEEQVTNGLAIRMACLFLITRRG